MTAYLGHFAAIATSISWSVTSIFFTTGGRLVGSPVVNRVRLLLALPIVGLVHLAAQGQLLPVDAEPYRWGWLALSGVIGLALGDAFFLQSLVLLGPLLPMLLLALAPVFGAVLGWLVLGERLLLSEWLGIGLTVGGVVLVVTENRKSNSGGDATRQRPLAGILFGLGAALAQAVGLITSKTGLAGDFSPLSGSAIRLVAAAIAIWVVTVVRGRVRLTVQAVAAQPRALTAILGGTLAGPLLGATLSLVAVQRAPVGIASTLMSLSPIILLPVDWRVYGTRIGPRAVGGTLLAFAGTALLFL